MWIKISLFSTHERELHYFKNTFIHICISREIWTFRNHREIEREILAPFPRQKSDRWLGRLVSWANTIPQRHYTDALGEIANPLHHDPRDTPYTLLLLCYPLYSRLRVKNFSHHPKQPFSRVWDSLSAAIGFIEQSISVCNMIIYFLKILYFNIFYIYLLNNT